MGEVIQPATIGRASAAAGFESLEGEEAVRIWQLMRAPFRRRRPQRTNQDFLTDRRLHVGKIVLHGF